MTWPAAVDDRRHHPPADPDWTEAWVFELIAPELGLGATFELVLWPDRRLAGFHAATVSRDIGLVHLAEPAARLPTHPSLELRAPGLWAEVGVQTPLEHVTVDLEAFAVRLEGADDVFGRAYGERLPLGCELEWETVGDPVSAPRTASYDVPCHVHGELLVGAEVIEIDAWGWRAHRWGTGPAPVGLRGRGSDGSWWHEPGSRRRPDALGRVLRAPIAHLIGDAEGLEQALVFGPDGAAWLRGPLDPTR